MHVPLLLLGSRIASKWEQGTLPCRVAETGAERVLPWDQSGAKTILWCVLVPPGQVVQQLLAGAGGPCPTPEATGRAGMGQAVGQIPSGV